MLQKYRIFFLKFLVFTCIFTHTIDAKENYTFKSIQYVNDTLALDFARSDFYGLASFYNDNQLYSISENEINSILDESIIVDNQDVIIVVGQQQTLRLTNIHGKLSFTNNILSLSPIGDQKQSDLIGFEVLDNDKLKEMESIISKAKYFHLIRPLRNLSQFFEHVLYWIERTTHLSWGVCIILFSLLMKFALTPVNIMKNVSERNVQKISQIVEKDIQKIKSNFSGEIAHTKVMAVYKNAGVTPFYTLKPALFTLLQLPIWISVFNTLGEMSILKNQKFLWIHDLSKPDIIYSFESEIPFLGSSINLLPILMTVFFCLSIYLSQSNIKGFNISRRQKFNMYALGIAFLILFYPFPSSMVLYWTCSNVFFLGATIIELGLRKC